MKLLNIGYVQDASDLIELTFDDTSYPTYMIPGSLDAAKYLGKKVDCRYFYKDLNGIRSRIIISFDGKNYNNIGKMQFDQEELARAVNKHNLWLHGKYGGEKLYVSNANFYEVDFSNLNISGSYFKDCSFTRCCMESMVASCANFTSCYFVGVEAQFAVLGAATFYGCIFDNSNLKSSMMVATDISRLTVDKCNLSNSNFNRALLNCTNINNTIMNNVKLSGTSIRNSIVRCEECTDTDFSKARIDSYTQERLEV